MTGEDSAMATGGNTQQRKFFKEKKKKPLVHMCAEGVLVLNLVGNALALSLSLSLFFFTEFYLFSPCSSKCHALSLSLLLYSLSLSAILPFYFSS